MNVLNRLFFSNGRLVRGTLLLFAFLCYSCTDNKSNSSSKIRLRLPEYKASLGLQASHSSRPPRQQSLPTDKPGWLLAEPSSMAEIGCYALVVELPESADGSCKNSAGETLFKANQIFGLYSPGSEIEVDITSGSGRIFRLLAMSLAPGATCHSIGKKLSQLNYSNPILISKKEMDLKPGLNQVQLEIQLETATSVFSCSNSASRLEPSENTIDEPPTDSLPPATPVGPEVRLSGYPSAESKVLALAVSVSGADFTNYKYKITSAADCNGSEAYSSPRSLATPITDSLVGFPDGPLKLCVLGIQEDETVQGEATFHEWIKDTLAPLSPTLAINAQAQYTASINVSLALTAIGAHEMYVTDIVGCASGGSWETFSSTKNWVLPGTNSGFTVYAQFRDLAGNISACVSDGITHVSSPAALTINLGPTFTYPLTAVSATRTQLFQISNTGSIPATGLTVANLSAPFSLHSSSFSGTGGKCPANLSLAAGASCNIQVNFAPTANQTSTETISLTYSNGIGNQLVTRNIAGTGIHTAVLQISDASPYDFGVVNSDDTSNKIFTITNNGLGPATGLTSSSLYAAFSFAGGTFPGTGGNCGGTLSPSGTCLVSVNYSPPLGIFSSVNLQLDFHNNLMNTSVSRTLEGTGLDPQWTALTHGFGHSCGIKAGGGANNLFCWGYNARGELGNGNTTNSLVKQTVTGGHIWNQISSTDGTVCGVTNSGEGFCWGQNGQSQIGNASTTNSSSPVSLSTGWSAIKGSGSHSCGLTSSTLKCWGLNYNGKLGDNTTIDRNVPTTIYGADSWSNFALGLHHTCGVTTGGNLKCWGDNTHGQVGDGTTTHRSAPITISGFSANNSNLSNIGLGSFHSCAITSSGSLQCWGRNNYGQLGDASNTIRTSPVTVTGGDTWTQVAAGNDHTCGLTSSGAVKCWGYNNDGQLGDGSTTSRSSPVTAVASGAVSISTGQDFSCATLSPRGIKCWGRNVSGQLGTRENTGRTSPTLVNP